MIRFSSEDTLFGFKFASIDFTGDSTLDTVAELTEAVDDLDAALSGAASSGIEDKIKSNLLEKSVSKTYDEAKKEWALKKQWADPNGKCTLCGHNPIVYHFQIENKINNNTLILGSECILNYVHVSGFTKEELRLYLTRLRQRLHDRRFDAVDRATLDIWDKQDAVYASMKRMMDQLPSDFDLEEYKKQLARFRKIAGFKLPSDFESYIRNVSVMIDVMYTIYRTTKIQEIPDKIRRKQKTRSSDKLTDQEKLQLFIEFETHLLLLFKFGSPTEALDLILKEYKRYIENIVDSLDHQQAVIAADIMKHFNDLKQKIGSRNKIKEYINAWQEAVLRVLSSRFIDYASRIGDIDGVMAGKVRYLTEPVKNASNYISDWEYGDYFSTKRPENALYRVVTANRFEYLPPSSMTIPANHPIRKIAKIESHDLMDAVLTSIDREEIPLHLLDKTVLITNRFSVSVTAEAIVNNAGLLNRLDKGGILASAVSEAQKSEELRKSKEKEALQEYKDLISDAKSHQDSNNDWEAKFIADMEKKYTLKTQLSPRQLEWLMKVALRKSISQSKPSSASSSASISATPNKDITLQDFLEACKETMTPGSEKGFIESLLKGRYTKWNELSPRQQKWLQDIYTRGNKRNFPNKII